MAVDLTALPHPSGRRLAVRITKDAHRHLRSGHPWIFGDSITSISHEGAAGDLAVVFGEDRSFTAIGLWDPDSPIRIKVLHVGTPTPVDDDFWSTRIAAAIKARRGLIADPSHDAYRIVHGENDGFPGLVVDLYARVAVVKVYSPAWIVHLASIVPILAEHLDAESIVLRLARSVEPPPDLGLVEGAPLFGPAPDEPVIFLENGLRFEAHPTHGQKTGHFIDQRANRARVRELARDRRVLDVFCCTGGFSVHAAAGGAAEVHSVDLSAPAIETAVRNMARNGDEPGVQAVRHVPRHGDAFEVMGAMRTREERFDLVIIDPPSFAQRQSSVAGARAAYRRLTDLGVALTASGGTLVQASCSSRVGAEEFFAGVHEAALAAGAELQEIDRTGHPIDHPIGFPQGAYLKAIYATVHR